MRVISLLLWLSFTLTLEAKEVLVVPCDGLPHSFNKSYYLYRKKDAQGHLNHWKIVDRDLRAQGMRIRLSNLAEFTDPETTRERLKNVHRIIYNNIPEWVGPHWIERLSWIGKEKNVLIMWEPPSVIPHMYHPLILRLFGQVITWHDGYVNNKKFLKMNYPVRRDMCQDILPYAQKRLCTQISGNKQSSHRRELYSERLKAIRYFEARPHLEFDFYGNGWDPGQYRNYKGTTADKLATLRNYRFSLCYENISHVPGYITEKIFDCFAAGCVPIYWGASNIKSYIPKGCYILKEDFSSFGQLLKFLRTMDEAKYATYTDNIRAFLQSPQAHAFSDEALAGVITRTIHRDRVP